MPWQLAERSNGQTMRGIYESREEAEAHRAELVAEDPGYADVLVIRWDDSAEPEAEPEPPPDNAA